METEQNNPLDDSYMVALYRYLGSYPWFTVFQIAPDSDGTRDNFVRVSDAIEVKFTALTDDAVIQEAVRSLDAQEARVRDECNQKVAAIRQQKSQLLAIAHQPQS